MSKTATTPQSPSNRRALMKQGLNALLKEDESGETKEVPAVLHYEEPKTETDFKHEDSVIVPKVQIEKPIKQKDEPKKEVSEYTSRITLLTSDEIHKKMKIMAHHELTTLTDLINSALKKTIVQYEKTHGELVMIPKSQKKK